MYLYLFIQGWEDLCHNPDNIFITYLSKLHLTIQYSLVTHSAHSHSICTRVLATVRCKSRMPVYGAAAAVSGPRIVVLTIIILRSEDWRQFADVIVIVISSLRALSFLEPRQLNLRSCHQAITPAQCCKRLIGEVVQSRRRPLLGPSPGWKCLLALSHLRHY